MAIIGLQKRVWKKVREKSVKSQGILIRIMSGNPDSCLLRKFPNLVVYRANFPNLKGPRAPSQNCKKKIPAASLFLYMQKAGLLMRRLI